VTVGAARSAVAHLSAAAAASFGKSFSGASSAVSSAKNLTK